MEMIQAKNSPPLGRFLLCGSYVLLRDPKFRLEVKALFLKILNYYWNRQLEKNNLQQKHSDSIMLHYCVVRRKRAIFFVQ